MIVYVEAAGCPDACRHCAAEGRPPVGMHFSLNELHALREEWGALIVYHEPTAHPDFPVVYDPSIAVEHGGWLVTNGYGLARRADAEAVFRQMRALGLETIAFTLHGLRSHHDWFVCRRGAFDDILAATRRCREAGYHIEWQLFVDRRGLDDVAPLVEMSIQESGAAPLLVIPYHRVSRRLQCYEKFRPTRQDILDRQLHRLVSDPKKNTLAQPETLTAAAWLQAWRQKPQETELRHPFEPLTWPPAADFDNLTVYLRRDRQVYFDPLCAPPLPVGALAEGKAAILERILALAAPPHISVEPCPELLSAEELDSLHPVGFSVRYLLISKACFTERSKRG